MSKANGSIQNRNVAAIAECIAQHGPYLADAMKVVSAKGFDLPTKLDGVKLAIERGYITQEQYDAL